MTTETTTNATTTTDGASQTAPEAPATAAGEGSQQTATETKATEGAAPNASESAAGAEKPEGAPESYDFKAPEGKEFDPEVLGVFADAVKDANLSQDKAQALLDKIAPAIAEKQAKHLEELNKQWVETSRNDKEFGGDKLDENLAVAMKARDEFASDELRTLLKETNLGNNPEIIRLFYRVGKAISEDRFVGGKPGQGSEQSVAQRMYPNMNP